MAATHLTPSPPAQSGFAQRCALSISVTPRGSLGCSKEVESCKRMAINVRTYLSDVLPRLAAAHPDHVATLAATLTPAKWLAARTPAVAGWEAGVMGC